MDFIKLSNDVEMPVIGYGTFQTSNEECEKSVLTAIRAGYRLIDTAQAYKNEEAVGSAITKCDIAREELFITTKVNFKSYENTRAIVEESLQKLQTDYLDMVLLHWPFGDVYSAWRELEKLYADGKIRAIGVSNFEPDRMIDLISFNTMMPVVNQIETHLYCQRHEEHKWEDKYGVAHQAYAPLGQGKANTMFTEPEVQLISQKYGKTAAQVLLRYLVQNHVSIIPKSVHENRIKENINIFDFELSANEMSALKTLDEAKAMIGNPETPELVEAAMT